MKNTLTGYELSRAWFDFSFENPEKVKPAHTAVFFWFIELSNRMGWKEKIGVPRDNAMEATGINSKNTYSKVFKDLEEWGFYKIIQRSKNQNTANVISISAGSKFKSAEGSARGSALDKAIIQHHAEREASGGTIDKPINHKPINQQQQADAVGVHNLKTYNAFVDEVKQGYHQQWAEATYMRLKLKTGSLTPLLADFKNDLIRNETAHSTIQKLKHHLNNWLNRQNQIGNLNPYKLKAVGSI